MRPNAAHTAEAGFQPITVAQEALALRDPREPWGRSWDWHSRNENRGVQSTLGMRSSALAYAHFLQQRRTFFGSPVPEPGPCSLINMPVPGGWYGGTNTVAGQLFFFDDTVSWALFTNESGQGNFETLVGDIYEEIRNIQFADAWGCLPDLDNDGDVDLGDFGAFGAAFNSVIGDEHYNPDADFDRDGDVDLGDFGTFGAEFARTDC